MEVNCVRQRTALKIVLALRCGIIAGSTQLTSFTTAQTNDGPMPIESAAASVAESLEASLRNDAALADVFFAGIAKGWAVGDRGVIWHTADGGTTWREQASGVSCRLNSLHFIDARRGWAAGGAHRTQGRSTQGVLLQTIDGGGTWRAVPNLRLPLLNRIKFFDQNVGIAIGAGSDADPSGVFVTRDAGRNWRSLPTDKAGHWLAGDFLNAETGAVAASAGQFATISRSQVNHSPLSMPSLRGVHAMRLAAPTSGWLVGDGGLVMATSDLGRSWQSPLDALPANAAEHFDFHALAVYGQHVWIAGSPGTRVFHSPDGGKTWRSLATGQLAPIRAITFTDELRGWAAGDLGCILATHDGGRTWQRQRAGGGRAALVAVFATAADVPLEILAEYGASDGYIATVDLLHAENSNNRTHYAVESGRSREAMILAGAAVADTAWRFPLPHDDLALTPADMQAALNRANDGRAIEKLESHLVRTLRILRPDVVVTHSAMSGWGRATASSQTTQLHPPETIEQLVLRAVQAAGDPTQFVEFATDAGLEACQIKRVYGLLPPGSGGEESTVTSTFSPLLAASLADWTASARALLLAQHVAAPNTHELKLLLGEPAPDFAELSRAADGRGIFAGITISRGSEARRAAPQVLPDDLEDLRRMATRRGHLQKLLERTEGNAIWTGQVATLIDGLDAQGGGELLFQLAAGYRAAGRLDLAADSYYLLARRYPQHPLVDDALFWLVQFYASGEAGHRAAAPTFVRNEIAAEGTEVQAAALDVAGQTEVRPAAFDAPAIGLSRDDRLKRATQLAEYFKSARPLLYAEPAVRFAEVAAQRQLGYSNEAKRYFLSLDQRPASDPWRRCAMTEQWLAQPGEIPPPKVLAACRRTFERPHLDGQLDEPFWDSADRLRLSGDTVERRTIRPVDENNTTDTVTRSGDSAEVRLAYDEEFLYVAFHSPKVIGSDYSPDDRTRPRDTELTQHDRVSLQLDLDRDFTTAFELTVDHRGWTHESCWGDATWNPTWYVAAAGDDTTWTVEAAMPLAALTATAPASKHVWAVAARRIIPRVGYESWGGGSASVNSPDRFGLLIFE
jgi:photosystem II stability/assembly factor-like uncharacterized protein